MNKEVVSIKSLSYLLISFYKITLYNNIIIIIYHIKIKMFNKYIKNKINFMIGFKYHFYKFSWFNKN